MALRDQPYIPLYVNDLLTDEKLSMCSAESTGVYIRLMCILHKQNEYGKLCIKQKHKQNESKFVNFALLISKQMPYEQKQIERCLVELDEEGVIEVNEDCLSQKRMVKDGELSLMRAKVGKKGGSPVTKQYGKSGILYLMSDGYDKNKIGISVNPQNRLYRLRSDLKLPKHFEIKDTVNVDDMGKAEDISHDFFSGVMDGEWVKGDFNDIKNKFVLLKAKVKAKTRANAVNEFVIESENETENNFENVNFFKSENLNAVFSKWITMCSERGKMYTKTSISEIQSSLNAISEKDAMGQVEQSLKNGWVTIREVSKTESGKGKSRTTSIKETFDIPRDVDYSEGL